MKYNLSKIMRTAWALRRRNNMSMSEALKASWSFAKGGKDTVTKTYTWATPRGAKVSATITVEHITVNTVSADGFAIQTKCSEWSRTVDSMTVNGKVTKLRELYVERGTRCILIDRSGKDRVLVALPANVEREIFGEEDSEAKQRIDNMMKVERAAAQHRSSVYKMMNP